ncbi:hypothetical protein GCM10023189_30890 [Nibrella saemangeumensis]|uniref:Glycerophosphoryl diester phosphodiesterase membrane domain-containing protein n=1 Tax=Nibrella saemangeumensis TaxID=1084526 RepID=A0ABP8MZ04_9BACT
MLLFQERDFGEKINATFAYATQNFRSLTLALLYIAGPAALLAGIAEGVLQSNLLTKQNPLGQSIPSGNDQMGIIYNGPLLVILLTNILKLTANLIASLVVYSHFKLYSQSGSTFINAGAVWHEVLSVLGRSLWIAFLSFWLVLIGIFLMLVPGIYIGVVLSLALPVTVFEKAGPGNVITRCFQLIANKWWSTFGLIVIVALIVIILGLGFTIPTILIQMFTAMELLPEMPSVVMVLTNAISTIGVTFLSGLIALAIGFQYFNLVERHEGTGLLAAIDTIGTSPTRPTAQDEGDY